MGGGEVRVNKGWMKVLGSAFSFLVLSCPCIRGGGIWKWRLRLWGKGSFSSPPRLPGPEVQVQNSGAEEELGWWSVIYFGG